MLHFIGIRMLDQPYMTGESEVLVTQQRSFLALDLIEANSMAHEPDLIDIYSASWGKCCVNDGDAQHTSVDTFRTRRRWKNG